MTWTLGVVRIDSTGHVIDSMKFDLDVKLKNKDSHGFMKSPGADRPSEKLYIAGRDSVYLLDHQAKKYMAVPLMPREGTLSPTSETKNILGHTCTKYKLQGNAAVTFWYAQDIADIDIAALSNQIGDHPWHGSKGIPLTIEAHFPMMHYVMRALEIKKEDLPDSLFRIPDYERVDNLNISY